jgi:hypothetical protein
MATDLDIVNKALTKLGEKTIAQLAPPQNKIQRIANAEFAGCRDFVLADARWKFATERMTLPESVTAPAYGPLHAYPIGENVLTVWEVDGEEDDDWQIERHLSARAIYTDATAPLYVTATVRVTDLSVSDPSFRDALATYCAWQWCEAITGTMAKSEHLAQEYAQKISHARSMSGRQGSPHKTRVSNSWLDAR